MIFICIGVFIGTFSGFIIAGLLSSNTVADLEEENWKLREENCKLRYNEGVYKNVK